jgi:hypothetical protein
MKPTMTRIAIIAACASMQLVPSLHAAEEGAGGPDFSADKTGTNPVNFTFDARLYNEYSSLNTAGDGSQNVTTFEFRAPFADGKWQFRTKIRGVGFEADTNNNGIKNVDTYGFGDMDIRFLTVPIVNMEKRFAFAYGAEFFIPTGSNAVSSNAFSIGPQVFFAWFKPFGGFFDLIAPGYQHQFSVWKEGGASNVHLGLVDLFLLKTFNEQQQWFMLNPQTILNYEGQTEWVQFDIELGTMLDKWIEPKGHSVYLRPSFGIGTDRTYDWSVEAGYKIIW